MSPNPNTETLARLDRATEALDTIRTALVTITDEIAAMRATVIAAAEPLRRVSTTLSDA